VTPDDDDLGDCTSIGQLYARAGRQGVKVLTSMPQWQPGSKDRMQISAMISAIPGLGQVKMALEALTGKDWIGGRKLSGGERILNGVFVAAPTLGELAVEAGAGIKALAAESSIARGLRALPEVAPMTRQQGPEAEAAFRKWLQMEHDLELAPKAGANVGGPDAIVIGEKNLGWQLAELKPDRLGALLKGASQVRKRLRSGMEGPGALYGYRPDGDGGWIFRLVKIW
jgi:hypothetical protein